MGCAHSDYQSSTSRWLWNANPAGFEGRQHRQLFGRRQQRDGQQQIRAGHLPAAVFALENSSYRQREYTTPIFKRVAGIVRLISWHSMWKSAYRSFPSCLAAVSSWHGGRRQTCCFSEHYAGALQEGRRVRSSVEGRRPVWPADSSCSTGKLCDAQV